jgi:anti-sigma factor RsiW
VNSPLDCNQLVELVSDYVEDALSTEDRQRFEEHLAECDGCVNYVAQMRETIHLTGTLTVDDVTPQVRDELLSVFRSFHQEH